MTIRLPDDGTGALPPLRHVILNDDKSSTYNLGLLRALCRIADGAGGLVAQVDDECVAIPMGLVALTWLRLYKPLLGADLPQSPANTRGGERLGFAETAYDRLDAVSHHDLRVGMVLTGEAGTALHHALKDAARTIVHKPVRYMTYPNEPRSILPVQSGVGATHSTAMVRLGRFLSREFRDHARSDASVGGRAALHGVDRARHPGHGGSQLAVVDRASLPLGVRTRDAHPLRLRGRPILRYDAPMRWTR